MYFIQYIHYRVFSWESSQLLDVSKKNGQFEFKFDVAAISTTKEHDDIVMRFTQ